MNKRSSIALLVLALAACDQPDTNSVTAADRVFLDGAVYTVDPGNPWAEAVAVAGGTIVFVGNSENARAFVGPDTEVTRLEGRMLLPGLHDSHIHILIGVMAGDECSLLRLETVEDVARRLDECTALEGLGADSWITGGGWNEWLWPEANPNKGLLDALFPERPVYLESSFGHAAWVNTRALEIAGIGDDTANPDAGIIERDPETGEASGTLRESAMLLVKGKLPPLTFEQDVERVRAGVALANAHGITAVIEPGTDPDILRPVLALHDAGELSLRIVTSVSPINWQPGVFGDEVFEFLAQRDDWRRPGIDVDSVKIYMDGVIEYGTSPLLEPYADEDYGSGEFFYTQEQVDEFFTRFDAMGLQVHVHAIGDAAVRRALDGFEAMRETNGMSDNRHHITHLQLIHPDDRPRFAELNVAATCSRFGHTRTPRHSNSTFPCWAKSEPGRCTRSAASTRAAAGSSAAATTTLPT